MNEPNRTEWETRCAFNGFCKKALKFEASNAHRDVRHHQLREVTFSSLSLQEEEQLFTNDRYFADEEADDKSFLWQEWKLPRSCWLTLYTRCRKKNATLFCCTISLI